MLDLTQIHLAIREDRDHRLHRWAAFFRAATWEELKILAKTDLNLQEAVVTVRQLTQDEKIRQMCKAREDYYHRTTGREALLQKTILERDHLLQLLKLHGIDIGKDINEGKL